MGAGFMEPCCLFNSYELSAPGDYYLMETSII